MIVYKTTNLVNNKIYVGKDERNRQCYLGSGKVLKLAIKKYGRKNFKKEILEVCDLSNICEREVFWIKELDARNPEVGYNLTEGGEGTRGFSKIPWNKGKKIGPQSQEQRKKHSLRMLGKNNPMFGKYPTNSGKPKTEETKQKIRESILKYLKTHKNKE